MENEIDYKDVENIFRSKSNNQYSLIPIKIDGKRSVD